MHDSEIEKRLVEIIKDILKIHVLPDNMDWKSDMRIIGVNSISTIQMIVAVEEKFDIEFDDEDLSEERLNEFMELDKFVDYIGHKINNV